MKARSATRGQQRKPLASPSKGDGSSALAVAHAEWMQTCAALAQIDAYPDKVRDKKTAAALDRQQEAEWRIIRTPAADFGDIRLRAAITASALAKVESDGPYSDNRHKALVAVLLREVLGHVCGNGQ